MTRLWIGAYKGKADIDPVALAALPCADLIAVAMAGGIAGESSGVAEVYDDTISDDAQALNITSDAFPDDEARGEDLFRDGCNRAAAILDCHADLLTTLADALDRQGELNAEEIAAILLARSVSA